MLPCPTKSVGNNESVHVYKQGLILSTYSTPYRWIKTNCGWEGIGHSLSPVPDAVRQQRVMQTTTGMHCFGFASQIGVK